MYACCVGALKLLAGFGASKITHLAYDFPTMTKSIIIPPLPSLLPTPFGGFSLQNIRWYFYLVS
jgi:hypothetical protein